jgi:hypothetical protein
VHKSGISLVDVSSRNLLVCNGKFKFIDVGFAKLYANILDHVDDPNFIFGNRKFRSPWAHIVSKIPTHLYKSTPWKLKESNFCFVCFTLNYFMYSLNQYITQ